MDLTSDPALTGSPALTASSTPAASSTLAASPTVTAPVPRLLRGTLYLIAAFQLVLGAAFLVAPAAMAAALGLPAAPGWTGWLFAMMAARFLGYGVGMVLAARDPGRHRAWIDTMIVIQAIDWLATVGHVLAGDVTWRQVSTAGFMPVLFVGVLAAFRLRDRRSR